MRQDNYNHVIQLGSLANQVYSTRDNPQRQRVYDGGGISPTIYTYQGGGLIPLVIRYERK